MAKNGCYNININKIRNKKGDKLSMVDIVLNNTLTGENKKYLVVDKDYILRTARLINIEEAEELLINEYHTTGENIRYDLVVNILTGALEVKKLYNNRYNDYNFYVPLLSLDVTRGYFDIFCWIDDELEDLTQYLETLYKRTLN